MPGVIVTTSVRTGPTAVQTAATATAFVAGVTERGPSGSATLISSIDQYESIYGGYVSTGYVHQTVKTFFEEGGARLYVSRAVGDGAAAATCAIIDGEDPAGTVITLTAVGKGTWANTALTADVVVEGSDFYVVIRQDGTQVYRTGAYDNKADVVLDINESPVAALFVTATAGSSNETPAADTDIAFSGGSNGSTVDQDNVVEAIGYFTYDLGPGAVMAPGYYDSTTVNALIAHANTNHRIVLTSVDKGSTAAEAVSDLEPYVGAENSEHVAAYWPWVKIPNGQLTMTIPPEGFVAAKRAATQNSSGVFYPYAGEAGQAKYVVELERTVSKEDSDTADAGSLNAIRIIQNNIRVYGARSLSADTDNFRFITGQEVLNYIVYACERDLEYLIFQPIDGRRTIFARVASTIAAILDPLAKAGGLFAIYDANGKQVDPGYSVRVTDALNPISQLAQGKIVAKVGARVSGIGDTIEVEVTKSSLTASLV